MSKQGDAPQNPHIWPYMVACTIVLIVPIAAVIAYVFIDGFAERPFEDNIFLVAILMIPMWWALDYVLAAPTTHRLLPIIISSGAQERLSKSLFFGVLGSLFLLESVTGAWAIATQFIGGVLIIACVVITVDVVTDVLWAGLKRMWHNR